MSHPEGIAFDASGNVYVVDNLNDRVEVFSSPAVNDHVYLPFVAR